MKRQFLHCAAIMLTCICQWLWNVGIVTFNSNHSLHHQPTTHMAD